jgi:hypothetical protein
MKSFRNAWIGLALALALHVTDEALTGFLPLYNRIVTDLKGQHSWIPIPTFTFPVWIFGLGLGILLLLALTPLAARGKRPIRVIAMLLGVIMMGNALVHMGASIYWGKAAPGVYSSPVLLLAAGMLLGTALHPSKAPAATI